MREWRSRVSGCRDAQGVPAGNDIVEGSTKTDPIYAAMLLVIDRSGSMWGIRDDMVGGLTAMLAEQAGEPGRLTVDIVTFDTEIERQCSLADPAEVTVVLEPRGATALFDAIGQSVADFGRVLAAMPEEARPDTVQVVVVTDGEENSSVEFDVGAVRALVTRQKEQFSWDFVFLGANQDAVFAGERLGFDAGSSMTFAPGAEAVSLMSVSVSRYVKDVRGKRKRGFDAEERLGSMSAEPTAPDADGVAAE
ncbi:VWA domain-containing protein [Cryobacterium breve]|uniref:VWA domain-containing protein n=1 Tax=Cryobacterium breve TaxID=1259258 RepID=A0ABY7NJ51_9MICO|nr:VWA domain-containing protein [Cryobacterium breve]WBM80901.1 VWA domain-containing protein [Cryobacterium breve]